MRKKMYELTPIYDTRKSFYKKAMIKREDNGTKTLYSYGTKVAEINYNEDNIRVIKIYGFYSNTTLRHIKEFIKQEYENREYTKKELEQYLV